MNKFVLLAVVCVLGSAVADVLPGDPRYKGGNNGYSYSQPQQHHHHQASQPSRSYLQPVQEVKQAPIRAERPAFYNAPKPKYHAPVYQVEQVRSVEQHSYTETVNQPAAVYGPPAPVAPVVQDVIKSAPVAPHKTYGAPQMQVAQPAQTVPHKTYGAPAVHREVVKATPVVAPHKTYGAPAVKKPTYTPAPSVKTDVKFELPQTSYGTPFKTYEAPQVHHQEPAQVHQTYEAPQVHQTYEAPQVHQTYEAPQVHQTYEAPQVHQTYEAPQVHHVHQAHQSHHVQQTFEAPQVHHVQQTYEAPQVHHTHETHHVHHHEAPAVHQTYEVPHIVHHHDVHVHHEEQHVEQVPTVQTQVYREPAQTYIPVQQAEPVHVEHHEHVQPIAENGGYSY